jgi:hypothetical protein
MLYKTPHRKLKDGATRTPLKTRDELRAIVLFVLLLAIVLFVLLSFGHCVVCPSSFGHCVVCPSSKQHNGQKKEGKTTQ